jgi:hypothetical protein
MTESTEFSSKILFEKNHIKSTQILEKIKNKQFNEILNGIGHIKDECIIVEFKFFKYFCMPVTYDLITAAGYQIVNIDATLCLEAPKIKPYVLEMQNCIASILKIGDKDISIKATTTETMGFTGREEGLVAMATCLLSEINS